MLSGMGMGMDIARNDSSFGGFPGLESPIEWGEAAKSFDLSSIGDVFPIEDLSEFSNEDIAGPIPSGSLSSSLSSPGSSQDMAKHTICKSFLNEGDFICPPYEDGIGLEWLSDFVEDSFAATGSSNSGSLADLSDDIIDDGGEKKKQSPTDEAIIPQVPPIKETPRSQRAVPRRPRSKRPRSSGAPIRGWSTSEDYALRHEGGMKTVTGTGAINNYQSSASQQQPRRCTHCLSQRTPQWRLGPLGPKTLCNACGVRFKSGRLFPEYRPAKSPTFIRYIHSNSHKKVLEMRNQEADDLESLVFDPQLSDAKQQDQGLLKVKIKLTGLDNLSFQSN